MRVTEKRLQGAGHHRGLGKVIPTIPYYSTVPIQVCLFKLPGMQISSKVLMETGGVLRLVFARKAEVSVIDSWVWFSSFESIPISVH
jgi:hypothetical protein